jgi:hypothetical protein
MRLKGDAVFYRHLADFLWRKEIWEDHGLDSWTDISFLL